MKYTKVIICGGKRIEISDDTQMTIRLASDIEKELFAKTHWNWPKELPCQIDMWKSLCEMLDTLEQETSLWGSSRKKSGKNVWRY